MDKYNTVKEELKVVTYEKKSEFISYISPVKTEKDAQEFLGEIRKRHFDASHNCYAYILKDENIEKQSDDGEPAKTAGMPILTTLQHSGLEDVIVIVTRYFGGTLLGTGGLVRAYTNATKAVIENSEIVSYNLCVDLIINIDYSLYDKLMLLAKNNNAKILNTIYKDNIEVTFRTISGTQNNLIEEIKELTKGKEPLVTDEFLEIF